MRLFLALLAVVTGLFTQVGPAEAWARGSETEIGSVLAAGHSGQVAARVAAGGIVPAQPARPRVMLAGPAMAAPALAPATVRIGIDRARQ